MAIRSAIEFWTVVDGRFDPAVDDRREWIVPRADSPATKITTALRYAGSAKKVVLSGGVGAGKSTEIERVATDLQHDYFVVFFDLFKHLHRIKASAALETLEPWEVCLLVGLALLAASERSATLEGAELTERREALVRALESLRASDAPLFKGEVDVAKLIGSVAVLVSSSVGGAIGGPPGTAAGAAVGTGLKELVASVEAKGGLFSFGGKSRSDDQSSPVQQLLLAVNETVALLARKSRRVLLVVDGLDRIRDIARAKRLFVESQLLASIDGTVLLAAPHAFFQSLDATRIDGFEVQRLLHERVFEPKRCYDWRELSGGEQGREFFRAIVNARVRDLVLDFRVVHSGFVPFTDELIDALAVASGGRCRAFIELVRSTAANAIARISERESQPPEATRQDVDGAIDKLRRDMESGMLGEHYAYLQGIIESERFLPKSEGPLWDKLFFSHRIFVYENGTQWFFPHPLLLPRLRPLGG
jgi:hypothetical protein